MRSQREADFYEPGRGSSPDTDSARVFNFSASRTVRNTFFYCLRPPRLWRFVTAAHTDGDTGKSVHATPKREAGGKEETKGKPVRTAPGDPGRPRVSGAPDRGRPSGRAVVGLSVCLSSVCQGTALSRSQILCRGTKDRGGPGSQRVCSPAAATGPTSPENTQEEACT